MWINAKSEPLGTVEGGSFGANSADLARVLELATHSTGIPSQHSTCPGHLQPYFGFNQHISITLKRRYLIYVSSRAHLLRLPRAPLAAAVKNAPTSLCRWMDAAERLAALPAPPTSSAAAAQLPPAP
eukprot:scaffold76387_cov72-Phaeocystis_antarctica.AAC.4